MVITTLLREKILRTSVFKGYEILMGSVILKAKLIPLEMNDFDVILGIGWLSNHRALIDCFTKKMVFKKSGYPDLKF